MEQNAKSQKYLTVQILGSKGIRVNCFRNEKKEKDSKQPDFLGSGIAIWINEKKQEEQYEDFGIEQI